MAKAYEGKVVLVTGANSGIGEAIAVCFAEAGATVYGVARKQETLEAARARHPLMRWVLADATDARQVRGAVESVVKEAGRLDVLVNNAGIFHLTTLAETTDDMVRRQFETNVYGPTWFMQAALPALVASRGAVVNISSNAGHKALPLGSHYGATKAAIESLTRSWALELAPRGVRVNAIAPGPVDTPGFAKSGLPPDVVSAQKQAVTKMVPLSRMGTSEEVARWVVAIADPKVTWVTGQVLSVDGGMSL